MMKAASSSSSSSSYMDDANAARVIIDGIVDPNAMDLLSKMLLYHPAQRISACQALNHPLFSGIADDNNRVCAWPKPFQSRIHRVAIDRIGNQPTAQPSTDSMDILVDEVLACS